MTISKRCSGWSAAAAAWLIAIAAGFQLLHGYETTPGEDAATPPRLPAGGGWRMRVFLHPRCPCSRATLAEVAALLERGGGTVAAEVLVFRPANDESWAAPSVPGARVRWDEDGREARQFGVRTSGHVLLYDAAGTLRFSGGVTAARGRFGDSAGGRAVREVLAGSAGLQSAPVFGCPLTESCPCLAQGSDACPR